MEFKGQLGRKGDHKGLAGGICLKDVEHPLQSGRKARTRRSQVSSTVLHLKSFFKDVFIMYAMICLHVCLQARGGLQISLRVSVSHVDAGN